MYLLCGFTVVGSSGYRHQGRPVLQKHLPLTHITPDPERCQVHSQVVLLSLKETHSQSFKGLIFRLITSTKEVKQWQEELAGVFNGRGFYLCVQGAVIREGLSTADIGAVILQSRNTVSDMILLLLSRTDVTSQYLPELA